MAEAFPLLRRCHLFIAVPDAELKDLAAHFVAEEVAEGEYVFRQAEPADAFYMIESGQVEVSAINLFTGQERKLTHLVQGDYFGEMGLVRHGPRSASVKALKPLKLWKLTREEFDEFVVGNSRVKPELEVAIRSRRFARKANFKWLLPGEIVYLVTLRHSVFLVEMLWKPVLVLLAAVTAAFGMLWYGLPWNWQVAPLALLLAGAGWFWWNWIDFHNDWFVVTNQRVVDIDKVLLFYDSRAEAPLPTVQNTTIKTDEWGRQFNYGDVIINTFSGPVTFHQVPHPQATADMILEQVNRTRVQLKLSEREQLKKTMRLAIGFDKPPDKQAGPPSASKPAAAGLMSMLRSIDFTVREQQGDTIIYHKHPLILVAELRSQLLGIAIAIIIVSISPFFLPQYAVWILGLGVVALVILISMVAYGYLDWKNDIYMVTPAQIFDLEKKPFGQEQRKAANLDNITNISFVRPGLVATLLNFGTVTINSGPGGEMKFFNVYDPPSVQQDIYRRKEARERGKAEAAAKQRVDEMGQYFSVFYEIMEEERKKEQQG